MSYPIINVYKAINMSYPTIFLLCMQLAFYLEGGPLMWMMPLHLHSNQKSDYDMRIYDEIPL